MKVTKLTRRDLENKDFEVKLGGMIEIDGKLYKAVEDCTACPFWDDKFMCNHMVCTRAHRKDHKSIHFVEV